jgi:hypothetical protein
MAEHGLLLCVTHAGRGSQTSVLGNRFSGDSRPGQTTAYKGCASKRNSQSPQDPTVSIPATPGIQCNK